MQFSQTIDGVEYIDPVCRVCGEPIENIRGRWSHLHLRADHAAWLADEVARICQEPLANIALQVMNALRNRLAPQDPERNFGFLNASWAVEQTDKELIYTVRIPLADKA